MRLNEATYPAYSVLEAGKFEQLKIDQMFGEMIKSNDDFLLFLSSLKEISKQVKNRYYLTTPFKQAIITAYPKIANNNKQLNEIPTDCGVIFTDKGFSIYLSNPKYHDFKFVVYGFTKDVLTTYGYVNSNGLLGGVASTIKDGKGFNDKQILSDYINSILVSIYFIHNCDLEQKIIEPNTKYKSGSDKHFNESKSNLIILDCRWFTELIRNTPFHVKGHLRWQNHGVNFSKKKLLWISDFEKTGYHRKPTKEVAL